MRHRGALKVEERGELGGPQACPVRERIEALMASEFGTHRERKQWDEGIAHAAWIALILQCFQFRRERLDTKGKREVGGQLERKGQCGSVHGTPRVGLIGLSIHSVPNPGVLRSSDFAFALPSYASS